MLASRKRHTTLAAVLALALVSSCRAVDLRAYNLDQLHGQDGRHHFSAGLEGPMEYYFRHVLVPAIVGPKSKLALKDPKRVKDPAETCLEELLALEKLDLTERYNRARAIQWCARIAAEDSALLSRERALLVLAHAAAPLGTVLPVAPAKDRPIAAPDAVASAIGSLVAAAKPLIGVGEWNATAEADLEAAIGLVRSLNLDLDGARRALEVACSLGARAGFEGRGAGIEKLVTELERTCVSRSIALGLADDAPRAQAAAIEAAEAIAGHGVLAGLLMQGAYQPRTPAIVLERILSCIRARGLPLESPEPGAPPAETLREQQLEALVHIALDVDREPVVRVAAMGALSAVSGSGLESLREEDWQEWWDLHTAHLAAGGGAP